MSKFIKTNISKAYWCTPDGFEEAENSQSRKNETSNFFNLESEYELNGISWFDNLFEGGGIEIPESQGKPLIMLLSGPPGSGKTTLALELCLRVAINHGFWSLYISTESETAQLKEKAIALGVKGGKERVVAYDKTISKEAAAAISKGLKLGLMIYGQENIPEWSTFSEIVKLTIEDVTKFLTRIDSKALPKILNMIIPEGEPLSDVSRIFPDILVFDSLNIVKNEERHDFFEKIVKGRYSKTKLIIVVLDSHSTTSDHEMWEFACDNIIRLDYSTIKLDETSLRDYYLRHIEVVKARYQSHVLGKQQLKIYSPFKKLDEKDTDYKAKMQRAHPYRYEGGIYIYPSIHYYLSEYKRQGSTLEITSVPTPCKELNDMIAGFPEGRCTAFMGCRGAHKSHLGYLHLLDRVIKNKNSAEKEAGIIISLRDDERMTKQHLLKILREKKISEECGREIPTEKQLQKIREETSVILDDMLNDMDLEILYFPPGYITADEFFHRMFMSVYRLKKKQRKITLLFNSLDQLSARFPLCAHQSIFVPAMIEALSGEKVTSIFIAVDEPGQPPTQYGLLPMADLVLNFERYKVNKNDYCEAFDLPIEQNETGMLTEAVLLEVSRFAGGQRAGTKGLLDREVYPEDAIPTKPAHREPGIHFRKWDKEYSRR